MPRNGFNITSIYIHAASSLEEKKARSHNGVNTENRDIHLVIFVFSIMRNRGLTLSAVLNVCLFWPKIKLPCRYVDAKVNIWFNMPDLIISYMPTPEGNYNVVSETY